VAELSGPWERSTKTCSDGTHSPESSDGLCRPAGTSSARFLVWMSTSRPQPITLAVVRCRRGTHLERGERECLRARGSASRRADRKRFRSHRRPCLHASAGETSGRYARSAK